MCLSKMTAVSIIAAVERDATCNNLINDKWQFIAIPESWGFRGTARNIVHFVTLQDTSHPRIAGANKACTGITVVTVLAINVALKGSPGISEVESVERIDRYNISHTATQINMKDGSSYVFDWHATLNVRNPLISTKREWLMKRLGEQFVSFTGLSCDSPVPQPLPTPTPI